MNSPPTGKRVEAPQAKKPAWVGCLIVLGGALLIFVVTPAIALFVWRTQAARRVDAQLAAIRARGEPASAAELEKYYALAPGKEDITRNWLAASERFNTPEFNAALAEIPQTNESISTIPLPGEPWDELKKVRALLAAYQAEMDQMHAAAAADGSARYPTNFDAGFAMLLPHAQGARECARMLALEAYVRAHDGDTAGAAESIRAIQAAGRSLENEPIMISQLVRFACDGIARDVVSSTLGVVDYSDDDLRSIQEGFLAADPKRAMARSLQGERVLGMVGFEDPGAVMDANGGGGMAGGLLGGNTDLSYYLSKMEAYVAAAEQPWPEARTEVKRVSDQIDAEMRDSSLGRIQHIMSFMILPATPQMFDAAARSETANQAMAAAIAVEMFRRDQGRLPQSLEELAPTYLPVVPIDPYANGPLRYKVADKSYVVYGVGVDLTDNGGQMTPETGEPDIVVEVFFEKEEETRPKE